MALVPDPGPRSWKEPGSGSSLTASRSSSGGDGAFFALRSCHQQLLGDTGEFFSPDYLCSNPPLWCNWTIRVDPTKRVHLDLEDLTPDDVCHDKQDQVHVEDPAGGHKLLLKCWREAKFTSSTNMLEVVLLIGGWPSAPYRGFYGRYHAFGPPAVYNPEEVLTGEAPDPEQVESDLPADSGGGFDLKAEGPEDGEEVSQTSLEQVSSEPLWFRFTSFQSLMLRMFVCVMLT